MIISNNFDHFLFVFNFSSKTSNCIVNSWFLNLLQINSHSISDRLQHIFCIFEILIFLLSILFLFHFVSKWWTFKVLIPVLFLGNKNIFCNLQDPYSLGRCLNRRGILLSFNLNLSLFRCDILFYYFILNQGMWFWA